MEHKLTVQPLGLTLSVSAEQTLLAALQQAGVTVTADCGGVGLCRHCVVFLVDGEVEPLDPDQWVEVRDGGHRAILACQARLRSEATILLRAQSLAGDIAAAGLSAASAARLVEHGGGCRSALVRRVQVAVPLPSADDGTADWHRLERGLNEAAPDLAPLGVGLKVLQSLPTVLRRGNFSVHATVADRGDFREVIDLTPADAPSDPLLGIAVDIGTSTVVVQVVDLQSCQLLGQAAGTNVQKRYGADVIARLIWAEERSDGPGQMQELIAGQITSLAQEACRTAGLPASSIVAASFSGNTTMSTFALGADPAPIRREPHVPLGRDLPTFHAVDLGLGLHPRAPVFFAPPVSGFVGGDITAGVLATGMARSAELSLLVDIGTNGEIVLGNRDWLICCSCSAGPAFEGVDIAAGTHAVPGAIDRIEYDGDGDRFNWQTIGDRPPLGLCGTGLLEALATMLEGGLLDRTGHLVPQEGTDRVRRDEDELEVVIVPAGLSATGSDIVLRESEIDNLIRSKGAIYAGISSLLRALDLPASAIDRLYIAGSFGNRLRVEEAVTIGMLPDVPRERITFAGNTSLAGACLGLLDRSARDEMGDLARKMTYLELSNLPSFMDEFVAALFLPHTELERFPSQAILARCRTEAGSAGAAQVEECRHV